MVGHRGGRPQFHRPLLAHRARRRQKGRSQAHRPEVGVSVTPGIDNVTALTLLAKYPDLAALLRAVQAEGMGRRRCFARMTSSASRSRPTRYSRLLPQGHRSVLHRGAVHAQVRTAVAEMFKPDYPGNRVRLKAIGGGGGKGQRILGAPLPDFKAASRSASRAAAEGARAGARDPQRGQGNRCRRQQERAGRAQYRNHAPPGNPGARQRRVVHRARRPRLLAADARAEAARGLRHRKELHGHRQAAARDAEEARLPCERTCETQRMEDEAARFGRRWAWIRCRPSSASSIATSHFFMEVNTRIQVEHRVTELCYSLKFSNPGQPRDFFIVESLVEAMVLLARHKQAPAAPERMRASASVPRRA
jgi:hypothetical protein